MRSMQEALWMDRWFQSGAAPAPALCTEVLLVGWWGEEGALGVDEMPCAVSTPPSPPVSGTAKDTREGRLGGGGMDSPSTSLGVCGGGLIPLLRDRRRVCVPP